MTCGPLAFSVKDLMQSLREGPFTSLGGYPKLWLTSDGGVLCYSCVRVEIWQAARDTRDNAHSGWAVYDCGVNWEDPALHCDHCAKRIESAYAEDEAES